MFTGGKDIKDISATEYMHIRQKGYIDGRADEQRKCKEFIEENYISKDKIKAKIEEYNKQRQKAETQKINDMFVNYIDVLQELLEGV